MYRSKILAVFMVFAILLPVLPIGIFMPKEVYAGAEATLQLGVEVLLEDPEYRQLIEGKRVSLVTNQIGVDQEMNHLIDVLSKDPDVELVSLFGGEHGVRGNYQAGVRVPDMEDPETGIWVWSLYRTPARPRPTAETLENVDVLLFDMQEIGSRTWTYMYLMAECMRSCIEFKNDKGEQVKFVVLDRPNPLGGLVVEGPVRQMTEPNANDTGRFPVPSRYGMTMGELAQLYVGEYDHVWASPVISLSECDLAVVPCKGWRRDMYWDDTGLQFVLPSPNMPTYEAAFVYAGTVWFEPVNVSEGRGLTRPFEIIGAPYINPIEFAKNLNDLELPGVIFRASSQTGYNANQGVNYAGQLSHGVQVHITDKYTFSPIDASLAMMLTLKAMYGDEFNLPAGNVLIGDNRITNRLRAFQQGAGKAEILSEMDAIKADIQVGIDEFMPIREQYLISEYAVSGSAPEPQPAPEIKLGYEVLLDEYRDLVDGKNVGLVTNQTGVDTSLNHIADVFMEEGVNLTALFSPEYGVRGEKEAGGSSYIDDNGGTGLTVYRLYEENGVARPTADMLADVDVLLFDIQELGVRSYANLYLMSECMLSCAENDIQFVVLDRPNPLGGLEVDGFVLEPEVNSSIGRFPIPLRYGMTLGELALLFQGEYEHHEGTLLADVDLMVIPMENWEREMYYDETGLQYVWPSLDIPTFTANLTHASIGLLKGTTLSEGWGTTKSYEYFGAPFLQENLTAFTKELNDLGLPGVRFRAASMTPWSHASAAGAGIKYSNVGCFGVQLHIYDEHIYNPLDTSLGILTTLEKMYPDEMQNVFTPAFDEIAGNTWLKEMILSGASPAEIKDRMQPDLDAFMEIRREYLIYGNEPGMIEVENVKIDGLALQTVDIGEELQLTAIISPMDATITDITWVSHNEALATIDENGVLTGVGTGMVAIQAIAHNGVNATIMVRVF